MVTDEGNDLELKVLISLTTLLSIHGEKCKENNILIMSNIPIMKTVTFVRVNKSRRMRWVGHVAHMGEGRGFGGET
jgi:transposase-like protein